MKKRWIVLVVAAAVATVGIAAGTAMAAGQNGVDYRQKAVQENVQQQVKQEPASKPTAQAEASQAGTRCAGNHNESCMPDCTEEHGSNAGQTAETGCPYHGTDCPDDCMWYNDGVGCSSYDASTGTCPQHDGYCHTENDNSMVSPENGHHSESDHYSEDDHHDDDHYDEADHHDNESNHHNESGHNNSGHHDEDAQHHSERHH